MITTEEIAVYTDLMHRSVYDALLKHYDDLAELGQMILVEHNTRGKGRPGKVYHVSDKQALFIVAMLQNGKPKAKYLHKLLNHF